MHFATSNRPQEAKINRFTHSIPQFEPIKNELSLSKVTSPSFNKVFCQTQHKNAIPISQNYPSKPSKHLQSKAKVPNNFLQVLNKTLNNQKKQTNKVSSQINRQPGIILSKLGQEVRKASLFHDVQPTNVNMHLGRRYEETIKMIKFSGRAKPNLKALLICIDIISSKTNEKCTITRCIDLLYKKFILKKDCIYDLEPEVQKRRFKIQKQIIRKQSKQYYFQGVNLTTIQDLNLSDDDQFESQLDSWFESQKIHTQVGTETQDVQQKVNSQFQFQPTNLDLGNMFKGTKSSERIPIYQKQPQLNTQRDLIVTPFFNASNKSFDPTKDADPQSYLKKNTYIPPTNLLDPTSIRSSPLSIMNKKQHYTQRYRTQQRIAKTFCSIGYGMQVAREFLGPQIYSERNLYNNTITTIIRESFKKMEEYLVKQCGITGLRIMDRELFGTIKTQLVHCRKFLDEDTLRCFLAFIGMNYRIPEYKPPSVEEALNLHNYVREKALNKIRHKLKTKYTKDSIVYGLKSMRES